MKLARIPVNPEAVGRWKWDKGDELFRFLCASHGVSTTTNMPAQPLPGQV